MAQKLLKDQTTQELFLPFGLRFLHDIRQHHDSTAFERAVRLKVTERTVLQWQGELEERGVIVGKTVGREKHFRIQGNCLVGTIPLRSLLEHTAGVL